MDDPFFIVRDEVQKSLNAIRQLHEQLKKYRQTPQSDDKQRWTADELRQLLKSVEWDLQDLEETIGIVEKNPAKFRLASGEVERRREFVRSAKADVARIRADVEGLGNNSLGDGSYGTSSGAKIGTPGNNSNARTRNSGNGAGMLNPNTTTNALSAAAAGTSSRPAQLGISSPGKSRQPIDPLTSASQQSEDGRDLNFHQQMLMKEQDQQLDQVLHTVVNMKNIATVMNQEVGDQSLLIDSLNSKTDTMADKLRLAQAKVQRILKQEGVDNKTLCLIIGLSIVVVILIFLVI